MISPEYNHGYSPALKMPWIMSVKNGKANLQLILDMVQPMVHVQLIKIRQVGTQLGLIDSNAILEIRDILNETKQKLLRQMNLKSRHSMPSLKNYKNIIWIM